MSDLAVSRSNNVAAASVEPKIKNQYINFTPEYTKGLWKKAGNCASSNWQNTALKVIAFIPLVLLAILETAARFVYNAGIALLRATAYVWSCGKSATPPNTTQTPNTNPNREADPILQTKQDQTDSTTDARKSNFKEKAQKVYDELVLSNPKEHGQEYLRWKAAAQVAMKYPEESREFAAPEVNQTMLHEGPESICKTCQPLNSEEFSALLKQIRNTHPEFADKLEALRANPNTLPTPSETNDSCADPITELNGSRKNPNYEPDPTPDLRAEQDQPESPQAGAAPKATMTLPEYFAKDAEFSRKFCGEFSGKSKDPLQAAYWRATLEMSRLYPVDFGVHIKPREIRDMLLFDGLDMLKVKTPLDVYEEIRCFNQKDFSDLMNLLRGFEPSFVQKIEAEALKANSSIPSNSGASVLGGQPVPPAATPAKPKLSYQKELEKLVKAIPYSRTSTLEKAASLAASHPVEFRADKLLQKEVADQKTQSWMIFKNSSPQEFDTVMSVLRETHPHIAERIEGLLNIPEISVDDLALFYEQFYLLTKTYKSNAFLQAAAYKAKHPHFATYLAPHIAFLSASKIKDLTEEEQSSLLSAMEAKYPAWVKYIKETTESSTEISGDLSDFYSDLLDAIRTLIDNKGDNSTFLQQIFEKVSGRKKHSIFALETKESFYQFLLPYIVKMPAETLKSSPKFLNFLIGTTKTSAPKFSEELEKVKGDPKQATASQETPSPGIILPVEVAAKTNTKEVL